MFSDVLEVPLALSLVPVVGDVAQLLHQNRELTVRFNAAGVVRKVKVRDVN